jgi:hypothetical protein
MSRNELRALIEKASAAVEASVTHLGKISTQGVAVRRDGSYFTFRPVGDISKDDVITLIRKAFAEQSVIRYVLTAPSSRGVDTRGPAKFVIFSGEDEYGMMFARRRIGRSRLGPLTFVKNNSYYEGALVGLLPLHGTQH